MDDWLSLIQWPAFLASVAAAWREFATGFNPAAPTGGNGP